MFRPHLGCGIICSYVRATIVSVFLSFSNSWLGSGFVLSVGSSCDLYSFCGATVWTDLITLLTRAGLDVQRLLVWAVT